MLSDINTHVEILKLNLGCGTNYIPGFIHIDVREFDHIDFVSEVNKLEMFHSGQVDLIYASHVLEHFKRDETESVLKEWYRVLKENGILRLAVPDFESIVNIYMKNKDIDQIMGLLHGRQDYEYNIHYRSFDFFSLSKLLKKIGFKKVSKYDWKETIHRNYDDFSQAYIPHMDKENGMLMSLNVEAKK